MYRRSGDPASAEHWYSDALTTFSDCSDPRGIGYVKLGLGGHYAVLGERDAARGAYLTALAAFSRLNIRFGYYLAEYGVQELSSFNRATRK